MGCFDFHGPTNIESFMIHVPTVPTVPAVPGININPTLHARAGIGFEHSETFGTVGTIGTAGTVRNV